MKNYEDFVEDMLVSVIQGVREIRAKHDFKKEHSIVAGLIADLFIKSKKTVADAFPGDTRCVDLFDSMDALYRTFIASLSDEPEQKPEAELSEREKDILEIRKFAVRTASDSVQNQSELAKMLLDFKNKYAIRSSVEAEKALDIFFIAYCMEKELPSLDGAL